jgi:Molybdenum cofactor biosynthesis enzyme
MPEEGIPLIQHKDILTFEEIVEVVKYAVAMGVFKIRLTGGEPLVRKGIVDLVRLIANIPEIKDLSMTTNGILLDKYAQELKMAGLMRVNISLDTLDPEQYTYITRGGNIEDVFRGIKVAKEVGFSPIKLNAVVKGHSRTPEADALRQYAAQEGLEVRFIKQMSLEDGSFSVVEGGEGGNCQFCNRLRLTANGIIKPCLFNDLGYSVKEMGPREALYSAIRNKPECGTQNSSGEFYNIGG